MRLAVRPGHTLTLEPVSLTDDAIAIGTFSINSIVDPFDLPPYHIEQYRHGILASIIPPPLKLGIKLNLTITDPHAELALSLETIQASIRAMFGHRTEKEQMDVEDLLNSELEKQDEIIRALEAENRSLHAQVDRLTNNGKGQPS